MTTIYKTASEWAASTDILAAGQPGVETDTAKVKLGDGISLWSALDYASYVDYIAAEKDTAAPEDFGALGSDDTAVIQLALNSGKNVRFTKGVTYNIAGVLTVPSDTVISGHGATLNLASSTTDKNTFVLPTYTKNVILDGLSFIATRDQSVSTGEDAVATAYMDSNRECISLYQGVENIIIRNCSFDGVSSCVRFRATSATEDQPIWRRNIVIENMWAVNVSCALDGGRETDGIYVDNIHIETAPTTDYHHAIYIRTDLKNVRINNFYIKQDASTGTPISIYTINHSTESCAQPIYLSNGEIHAETMGAASNPYVIYADNVHFINDIETTATTAMTHAHWEESFGYYNNCTFENCYQIRNGVYTGCRFKLYPGNRGLVYVYGSRTTNPKVERTVLKDCIIDMNNSSILIYLDNGDNETGIPYSIKLKNCLVENLADEPAEAARLISISSKINTPYTIRFDDCSFDHPFALDLYKAEINGEKGALDIKAKRCSFKSNQSNFVRTPTTSNITKTYTLCDLNDVMM